jgi:hypothetical protein
MLVEQAAEAFSWWRGVRPIRIGRSSGSRCLSFKECPMSADGHPQEYLDR